jgi:hypothetical protein
MYVSTRSGPQARPLAVLVHGMGRTPVSMALLALRLRRAGFATALFGYSVTFEKYSACLGRLQRFIDARARPCVLIGHSLGGVLLRSVIPVLARPPAACFLLASPTRACVLARRFAPTFAYRLVTGEMGRLLADEAFMRAVPVPSCPAWAYVGVSGPRSRFYPIGEEANDGILKVSEAQLEGVPMVPVRAMHTFFMNSRPLVQDLVDKARAVLARTA